MVLRRIEVAGGDEWKVLPSTALFDFGHVELKKAVDPCQKLLPVCSEDTSVSYLVRLCAALFTLILPCCGDVCTKSFR